jgi:transcription elongation factor
MTIDERLQKLTERHEALTQTVELMAREMQGMQSFVKDIADSTARLLHIAQIHEHRITRLEGNSED